VRERESEREREREREREERKERERERERERECESVREKEREREKRERKRERERERHTEREKQIKRGDHAHLRLVDLVSFLAAGEQLHECTMIGIVQPDEPHPNVTACIVLQLSSSCTLLQLRPESGPGGTPQAGHRQVVAPEADAVLLHELGEDGKLHGHRRGLAGVARLRGQVRTRHARLVGEESSRSATVQEPCEDRHVVVTLHELHEVAPP
jgi:hypothetical protein